MSDQTTTTGAPVQVKAIDTPLPTSNQDPKLYMAIIAILGGVVLIMMLGGLVLAGLGKEVPPALIAIAAGAGGALGGALVGPAAKA